MEKYYQVNITILGLDGEELINKECRYPSLEDFSNADMFTYHLYNQAKVSEAQDMDDTRTDDEIKFGSKIKEGDARPHKNHGDVKNAMDNGLSADDMTNSN